MICTKTEGFYRRWRARKLLAKEKDCSRQSHFLAERQGVFFFFLRQNVLCRLPHLYLGDGEGPSGRLIGVD